MTHRRIPVILALGGIGCSVGFILVPPIRDASPAYRDLGNVAFVWHAMLLAGGLLTIGGVRRGSLKLENFGMTLLRGGMGMFVAAAIISGHLASWTLAWLLGASIVAMWERGNQLRKGRPWA